MYFKKLYFQYNSIFQYFNLKNKRKEKMNVERKKKNKRLTRVWTKIIGEKYAKEKNKNV